MNDFLCDFWKGSTGFTVWGLVFKVSGLGALSGCVFSLVFLMLCLSGFSKQPLAEHLKDFSRNC